ncbi:MAG TPA: NAD(P)-binding domain-containing protein [Myxococcales bacterium]|nr:NAD(P)-binding domain-containing protein [Myxococcales bacterium]
MLFLGASEVEAAGLRMPEVLEIVAAALEDKAAGRVELPPKLGLSPRPGAVLHAMPARAGDAVGMKWIASFPENRARGLPPTAGIIVLNDATTGIPQAVLDADWITTMRTGAVAAVAARTLARPGAAVAAILGPGRVGAAALQALRLALPGLRTVRAWAPRAETARRFAGEHHAEATTTAEQAVRGADVIVTAAPWPGGPPHVEPGWLAPGAFACSLDYDATFTPEAANAFDVRVTDDVAQMDLARAKGSFPNWPRFSELCMARRKDPDQRILCAALGLAIFDIAVATRILQLALDRRAGREAD